MQILAGVLNRLLRRKGGNSGVLSQLSPDRNCRFSSADAVQHLNAPEVGHASHEGECKRQHREDRETTFRRGGSVLEIKDEGIFRISHAHKSPLKREHRALLPAAHIAETRDSTQEQLPLLTT
jgi:hypothetical protein